MIRFVLALCVMVAAWFAPTVVHAQSTVQQYPCGTSSTSSTCDQGQAYALSRSNAQQIASCAERFPQATRVTAVKVEDNLAIKMYSTRFNCYNAGTTFYGERTVSAYFFGCTAPTVWNEALKQCFNPAECLQRNSSISSEPQPRTFTQRCIAGCTFKAIGPTVGVDGVFSAVYQYSGDMCTTDSQPRADEKTDKKQECKPTQAGLTFCLKANGEHCATASNGRQVCFKPGEVGEKDDGPVKQKRDPGTQEIPPNLQLPNGDTLTKQAGPLTKTTTVTDAAGNVQTITTTTTNYVTTSGANAGPKNSGETNDGSGDGKDNSDEDGSATGGGSCSQPPETAGDPILGMIARQTWETRCAIEKTEARGNGDITDCSQPYTVTVLGAANIKNASAENLRAQRAQLCPGEQAAPDPSQYTGEDEAPPEIAVKGGDFEPDDGGFGWGQTCPTIPPVDILGTSIAIDTSVFCNWMIVGGWFVLLLTGIKCLRMVTEA